LIANTVPVFLWILRRFMPGNCGQNPTGTWALRTRNRSGHNKSLNINKIIKLRVSFENK